MYAFCESAAFELFSVCALRVKYKSDMLQTALFYPSLEQLQTRARRVTIFKFNEFFDPGAGQVFQAAILPFKIESRFICLYDM